MFSPGITVFKPQTAKVQQDKISGKTSPEVDQLDFELVLFSSTVIDYDYIVGLIAEYT